MEKLSKEQADREADEFLKSLEVLEELGWTKGALVKDDGCVCIIGALGVAKNKLSSETAGLVRYEDLITVHQAAAFTTAAIKLYPKITDDPHIEGYIDVVYMFNDRMEVDKSMIKKVVKKAAKLLRKGEY